MRNPLLLAAGVAAATVAVMAFGSPARAADCPPGQVLEAPCAAPQPPCPATTPPCDL
ncbi:hypothetical protein [Synechococcus sp. CCY 9618]|uniref:hypothetical protein n=1 Tax=Synechococcus sp. CCY 9618 TaxID=2815602 RepID=UPI001C22E29C|nr:hypothetical protein [Synechococcus sp. CCY 9618]